MISACLVGRRHVDDVLDERSRPDHAELGFERVFGVVFVAYPDKVRFGRSTGTVASEYGSILVIGLGLRQKLS